MVATILLYALMKALDLVLGEVVVELYGVGGVDDEGKAECKEHEGRMSKNK